MIRKYKTNGSVQKKSYDFFELFNHFTTNHIGSAVRIESIQNRHVIFKSSFIYERTYINIRFMIPVEDEMFDSSENISSIYPRKYLDYISIRIDDRGEWMFY